MAENRILTAAYCRLSRPDEGSIERQETIIRNYIRSHKNEGFDYLQAYVDDGRTGTNFNRPGWKHLTRDCESGLIKCIIVKDLSRLGREYVDTGIKESCVEQYIKPPSAKAGGVDMRLKVALRLKPAKCLSLKDG